MKLEPLYVDRHLFVVVKPPGLLSQADRTGDPDLLAQAKELLMRDHGETGAVYLGLVHRLDRPASGVMVLARTTKAARRLGEQFRHRSAEKRYLALVEGAWAGWGTAVDYLVKEKRQVRVVPAGHAAARRAELSWRVLETGDELSLVEVELKTGRPHQVRVQLASRGHPILGDMRYGAARELDGQNLALHAYLLGVEHPLRKKRMRWTAPPPATWSGRFDQVVARWMAARE